VAAVYPALSSPRCNIGASYHLLLDAHENISWNDGFVAVLHIILRHNTLVHHPLLRQEICCHCFLQKGIADVFFIRQDFVQCAGKPVVVSCRRLDSVCSKSFSDIVIAFPFHKFPVYPFYNLSFFRIDDEVPVLILIVTEEAVCADLNLALLIAVLESKLHIL